jgi:hypothetical protein
MMWFKDVIRLLVISLVLTTWACDPVEVPEPKEEDPSFWSEIELDNTEYEWASGKSSIYNFSNYEAVRGDGIRFSSILQHDSCDYPCPSSFRIDLYGPEKWRIGQMVNPDMQFKPADRGWFRENEKVTGITLLGKLEEVDPLAQKPERIIWTLNGEVVPPTMDGFKSVIVDPSKPYNLCMTAMGKEGNRHQICHSGKDIHAKPLSVHMIGRKNPNSSFAELMAVVDMSSGVPPFKYFWNGKRDSFPKKNFESTSDTMSVKLEIEDSKGTKVTIKNTIHFGNARVFPLNAQLKVNTERSEILAPLFNKASVRWVDREGTEYSTSFGEQPHWASFRVERVEPFRNSATGDPMVKVGLAFKGVLYAKDKPQREVRSGRATMLFSYPK